MNIGFLAFPMVALTLSMSAFAAPRSQTNSCPDLSGKWSCQACHEDRGPYQTGYSISQTSTGQFTDYEFPGFPEPVRYTAHSGRVLEFGSAQVSCKDARVFSIQMRDETGKKSTQLMERLGPDSFVVQSKEEGVNQFGNNYEKIRLEVCKPAKPEVPCPTCPFIPPVPPARGDECELLRAEVSQLRSRLPKIDHSKESK